MRFSFEPPAASLSIGHIFLPENRVLFAGRPGRGPFRGARGTPNSPAARARTAGSPANTAKWPSLRAIFVEIEM
jgi:hypothetical protein